LQEGNWLKIREIFAIGPEDLTKLPQIAALSSDLALVKMRKILETIITHLYAGHYNDTADLARMMTRLHERQVFPRNINDYAQFLRRLGNFGAHDSNVTMADFEGVHPVFLLFLSWFFESQGYFRGAAGNGATPEGPASHVPSPGTAPQAPSTPVASPTTFSPLPTPTSTPQPAEAFAGTPGPEDLTTFRGVRIRQAEEQTLRQIEERYHVTMTPRELNMATQNTHITPINYADVLNGSVVKIHLDRLSACPELPPEVSQFPRLAHLKISRSRMFVTAAQLQRLPAVHALTFDGQVDVSELADHDLPAVLPQVKVIYSGLTLPVEKKRAYGARGLAIRPTQATTTFLSCCCWCGFFILALALTPFF
jgi:hypothetical protein